MFKVEACDQVAPAAQTRCAEGRREGAAVLMFKDNKGEPTGSCRARLVPHREHIDAVLYVEEHRVSVLSLQVHFAAGCVLIGR